MEISRANCNPCCIIYFFFLDSFMTYFGSHKNGSLTFGQDHLLELPDVCKAFQLLARICRKMPIF